jgi:hypothetical protein
MEWGIGLLWGEHWAAWCLKDGWKGPSWDNSWLEGVAVDLFFIFIFIFWINILYCDCISYMYRALCEVITWRRGGYNRK